MIKYACRMLSFLFCPTPQLETTVYKFTSLQEGPTSTHTQRLFRPAPSKRSRFVSQPLMPLHFCSALPPPSLVNKCGLQKWSILFTPFFFHSAPASPATAMVNHTSSLPLCIKSNCLQQVSKMSKCQSQISRSIGFEEWCMSSNDSHLCSTMFLVLKIQNNLDKEIKICVQHASIPHSFIPVST